jgi:cytochrome c-type biogenesis protein CcmH/NrfG
MNRRQKVLILVASLLLVPTALFAGWWFWPPSPVREAEKALAASDLARAEEILKDFTRREPNHLQGQLLYAQVLRRLKRHEEAQTALLQAVQLGLAERERRRELALLQAAQFSAEVERDLVWVLERQPNDVDVLQALAEGYARGQRHEEADRYFTRCLELEPDRVEAWLGRGRVRRDAAKRFTARSGEAVADFREVLRRSPDHFEGHLYLALSLLSDAHVAEAEEVFRGCQRLHPDRLEPLIGLAGCALENGDWQEAQALLDRVFTREPRSVEALALQGDLHLRQQRYEQAIPVFRKVLALDPRDFGARSKLAQALRYCGEIEQAKEQERIYLFMQKNLDQAQGTR